MTANRIMAGLTVLMDSLPAGYVLGRRFSSYLRTPKPMDSRTALGVSERLAIGPKYQVLQAMLNRSLPILGFVVKSHRGSHPVVEKQTRQYYALCIAVFVKDAHTGRRLTACDSLGWPGSGEQNGS
jgi:hypothetical protein